MTYSLITCQAESAQCATIGDALRLAITEPYISTFQPPVIVRDDTQQHVVLELMGNGAVGYSLSVDAVQSLARLAGIDPRENEADGLHWPYAPSIAEAAAALESFA